MVDKENCIVYFFSFYITMIVLIHVVLGGFVLGIVCGYGSICVVNYIIIIVVFCSVWCKLVLCLVLVRGVVVVV